MSVIQQQCSIESKGNLFSFEDISLCASCRKSCKNNRYFIVNAAGGNGPVHPLLSEFLGVIIQNNPQLHSSYLCRDCRNILIKWKHHNDIAAHCRDNVLNNFQKFAKNQCSSSAVFCAPHSVTTPKKYNKLLNVTPVTTPKKVKNVQSSLKDKENVPVNVDTPVKSYGHKS
jgi:hypothetical protein